jgi:hypothetical protein
MAKLTRLRKDTPRDIWICPYEGVVEFPSYTDAKGERRRVSEDWREVSFRVVYPTMKVLTAIASRSTRLQVVKGMSAPQKELDPERLADFVASSIILDWENVTDDGGSPVPYDSSFMREQFMVSPFLLNEFIAYYHRVGEDLVAEKEREREGFLQL